MKILFNALYGAFIGILVFVGAVFLLPFTPFNLGIEAKIVQSGSMAPSIPVGALIFVAPSSSYNMGDVVTFGEDSAGAIPTTHRIVALEGEGRAQAYTTKGDANEDADPFVVAKPDIIGKVYLSIPYAGFILDFARQPLGFALLIGVPAFLVVISELAAIAHELVGGRPPARALGLTRIVRHAWWRRPRRARAPHVPMRHSGFERRFATDDVFVPIRVRHVPVAHYTSAFTSGAAVLCLAVLVSLQGIGGTLSYFRDTETSSGNTFAASAEFPSAGGTSSGEAVVLGASASLETAAEDGPEEAAAEETSNEPDVPEEIQAEQREERGVREEEREEEGGVSDERGTREEPQGREEREPRLPPEPEPPVPVEETSSDEEPVVEELSEPESPPEESETVEEFEERGGAPPVEASLEDEPSEEPTDEPAPSDE